MPLIPGSHLGHYEIESLIGTGGMGEVYRAKDSQLGRIVAIKILTAEVALRADSRSRFEREARAASALNHPGVAHIYEIAEADGQRFIAMEFVEGERLDQKIKGRPLALEAIADIGAAIADALDAAHAKGIIHRDIKPANVIVTPRGQVKVLDFGLARVDQPSSPSDATVAASEPGLVVGTVQDMSPEQALGRAVDARSDLFSLGVVLYEMATGRLPFSGLTTTETIERITHAQPDAVSRLNYNVPPALEHIIRKCLEKSADRRYQSARELLVDLKNLRRDSGEGQVTARPAPRSRRGLVIAAAVGLVVIAAAGWFVWSQRGGVARFDSVAVLPFAFSTGDQDIEYLADGLTETLINNLSRVANLRVVPRGISFRYKNKDADPQAAAKDLNVQAIVMGRVTKRAGALAVQVELIEAATPSQLWGNQYERVSDVLGLQRELTDAIATRLQPSLASAAKPRAAGRETTDNEAFQFYLKGRHYWNKRTEDGLRRGLENFNQAINRDPTYAKAYAGTADSYSLLARYQFVAPSEGFPLARAAALKALELDDTVADVHTSLAYVATYFDRDWATAEREFQRAIALDPKYATAHHWYGLLLVIRGDMDGAIRSLTEAQRLEPLSLIINANLGRMYYYAGQYDRAIESHRKALELDPAFGEGLLRLSWVYDQQGRYDLAIDALRRAGFGAEVSGAKGALGHALARAGRRAEAQAILADLEAVARRQYVDRYELALVQIGLGSVDQAFAALTRAAAEHSAMVVYAAVDPMLEPLRKDARFAQLLASMGLTRSR